MNDDIEASTHEGRADGRDESINERADRNWDELMQELRVMQTGTQVLTGFLLAMAFQPRFTEMDAVQHGAYIVLVVLAAVATVLSLTPVGLHRMLFATQRKPELVRVSATIVKIALIVVIVLSIGVTGFIVDFTVGRLAGILAIAVASAIVAGLWIVLPQRVRRSQG